MSKTTTPRHLLGIWSHPDDEAYLSAGLMARTIDNGGQVTLLTLTDGEKGFPAEDRRTTEERVALRRGELASAMAEIGVTDVHFLGIPDGDIARTEPAFLVGVIGRLMADVNPDAVVTFGPDGFTGHDDHVATGALTTQAWLQNQQGQLLYTTKSTQWLDRWRELNNRFGVWMPEEPIGVACEDMAFTINMEHGELERKRAVLAAHHSQTAGLAAAFGERRYRQWVSEEAFRLPTTAELDHIGRYSPETMLQLAV